MLQHDNMKTRDLDLTPVVNRKTKIDERQKERDHCYQQAMLRAGCTLQDTAHGWVATAPHAPWLKNIGK